MDFVQNLDPSKLVFVETILSFAVSAFSSPTYNLPIFLFGTYAQENAEAVQSLKTFVFLLAGSLVYDIVWLATHRQNWFIRTLTIITLILKVPTALSFVSALQRGGQLSGLGVRGNDLGGATVWSMPGGFTSSPFGGREGYQTVDDPVDNVAPKVNTPNGPPSSHPPSAPGAYQSV